MSLNNSDYSQPIIKVVTAGDVAEAKKEEKRQEALTKFFMATAAAASIAAGAKLFRDSPRAQAFIQDHNPLQVLNSTTTAGTQYSEYLDMKGDRKVTFSDIGLEAVRKAEELTPFRILRTFEMSHFFSPFTLGDQADVVLSSQSVQSTIPYLARLLEKEGNYSFSEITSRYGLRVKGGSMYEILDEEGTLGRKVLNNARITETHQKISAAAGLDDASKNRVLDKYMDILGVDRQYTRAGETRFLFDELHHSKQDMLTVIGSKKTSSLKVDWGRAYARAAFEKGVRVFDAPFDHMVDYFPDSKIAAKAKEYVKLNMGTAGDYSKSVPRSLLMMGKNIGKASLLFGGAYYAADALMSNIAPEDSAYSQGIAEGVATSAVQAQIGYAEMISDNFQGYKEQQELIAPGSTSLMTLAALPLMGAMHGGTASYVKRIYDTTVKGLTEANTLAETPKQVFGLISGLESARGKRWALRGAAIGLAAMIPFIPGALIGESSEELRAEYSGEKDIAVKKNRWWFSGGTEYEGQNTKYYTKGAYARLMSEGKTKSLYGDKETERNMNPFLNPFDYLRNPYQFEEMHQEDRPYPIWGMDVSYASFFGKAFEKTIGQLIKPDIINPNMQGHLSSEEGGTLMLSEGGLPIGSLTERSEIAIKNAITDKEFNITIPVSKTDASLIADDMLMAPESATYQPYKEAAAWSFSAFKDFLGLKGWAMGLAEDDMSLDVSPLAPQLARSGEANNMARDFANANIGGAFGATEAQRRFLPTSSGSIYERVNPLKNAMPSWLPGSDQEYFRDFSTGDPYTKIELGEFRLPGAGYQAIHKELEGFDPEDYPDIYKFKILSDVALGSKEYYAAKNKIEGRETGGGLTDYENQMLQTIRKQEVERGVKKKFTDYRTEDQLQNVGGVGKIMNAYWEGIAHNGETPAEYLTFFRPMAKLIHQRTAIEDYEKTQIHGSDLALWDKPIEQFVKPAINATRAMVDNSYVPEATEERRNVEEYFDKLEYLKYRKLYENAESQGDAEAARTYKAGYEKTIHGAQATGIDTEQELLRSYIALPTREKPYFTSFIEATGEDRTRISGMLSDSMSDLYETIWSRKDTMANAMANNENVAQALKEQAAAESQALIAENQDSYKAYQGSEKKGSFKEYMADNAAVKMIDAITGVPGEDFSGWDPRIDLDDVKLRALSVGGEDMHQYGFWKSDTERLSRLIAVLEDEQVATKIEQIKSGMKEQVRLKEDLRDTLEEKGLHAQFIELIESDENDIMLNVEAVE